MAKVMISLPDELLERIDRRVALEGLSRSAFLREAAQERLGSPQVAAFDAALQRARGAMEGAGSFDAAALIRAERDERDRRR